MEKMTSVQIIAARFTPSTVFDMDNEADSPAIEQQQEASH